MKPEIFQQIQDCLQRKEKLSKWEESFIDSLALFSHHAQLSIKQINTLDDIWEKVTASGGVHLKKLDEREELLKKLGEIKIKL